MITLSLHTNDSNPAEAVDELQDRLDGFDPATLAENDAFVEAVVTATRIVDRTSQRGKIEVAPMRSRRWR